MIEVDYNEYKETIAENMKLIQTNHKLKEKYYLMRTNANQLAKRINKAVEELDKYISYCETDGNSYDICKMALDSMKKTKLILKGSDK